MCKITTVRNTAKEGYLVLSECIRMPNLIWVSYKKTFPGKEGSPKDD